MQEIELEIIDPDWAEEVFFPETTGGIPVRYRVAKGGRGSSKLWQFARELILRAAAEPIIVLCTRVSSRSRSKTLCIVCWCHRPRCLGWLEEAQVTKQESLDMLIPTIRKPGSEVWCTYNPKNVDDAVHKMFVAEGRDNAIVRHVNYDENPWFPDVLRVEMEQLRAINPKLAERVWDGKIVEMGGRDYFPSDKLNYLDAVPAGIDKTVRAWDLAATKPSNENPGPDWTAGVKMAIDGQGRVIIIHAEAGQLDANEVRNLIRKTAELDQNSIVHLPQDPGQAGKEQAASYVKMLKGFKVKTERVTGDKEVRSTGLSAEWQAGNVYMVTDPWNEVFRISMNAFPTKGVHDDYTDASNDAFSALKNGSTYSWGNL